MFLVHLRKAGVMWIVGTVAPENIIVFTMEEQLDYILATGLLKSLQNDR